MTRKPNKRLLVSLLYQLSQSAAVDDKNIGTSLETTSNNKRQPRLHPLILNQIRLFLSRVIINFISDINVFNMSLVIFVTLEFKSNW